MNLDRLKIDRSPAPPTRKARRSFPWGPVLALGILGAGLYLFRAPLGTWIDSYRLPQVRVIRVQRAHPATMGAVQGKAANGYIVAARRAALSADTPGRIVEVNVEEGSVVKKGDVVARLYSDEYAASLRKAEADLTVAEASARQAVKETEAAELERQRLVKIASALDQEVIAAQAQEDWAKREFDRVQKLVESQVVSDRELDQARRDLDDALAQVRALEARSDAADGSVATARTQQQVAQTAAEVAAARVKTALAARDLAQATLDKTLVRAPFDGIVVLKDAEVGEVVSPNSQGGSNARGSVCTMVDFDSLEVQADVPETSIAAVEVDASAAIFLDAFPEITYTGRVSRIWPTANRQKATIEVRVIFDQPDERLRPEMGVRVVFTPEGADLDAPATEEPQELHLLVPTSALVQTEGRWGVFVLEQDRVRFRQVETGEERSGRTAVLAGLQGGERILAEPPLSLRDGHRIRIEEG